MRQAKPVAVLRGRYSPLYSFWKGDWFISETDLLAKYVLFFVSGQKELPFLFTFSLKDRKGTRSRREASLYYFKDVSSFC
jgi:hypothetical protein